MPSPTWKFFLATAAFSSGRQCSGESSGETCDDHSALLQSHVTSHKSNVLSLVEYGAQLKFPPMAFLSDPTKRKTALAQFEITATELASNRAAVTPVVVEVCESTADMLRETVMSAIISEHGTDVAMLASSYSAFGPIEEQRLGYETEMNALVANVYGTGGCIERHRQCRSTENEECRKCNECEEACEEIITRCELDEETLMIAHNEVIERMREQAVCANGHVEPPTSYEHITYAVHELNRPAINAYLAALAAFQNCTETQGPRCEECALEVPALLDLLAMPMTAHAVSDHAVSDPNTNEWCGIHTTTRTQCETEQEECQAAQCNSRQVVIERKSLYEQAFLAAAEAYLHQKASIMIMEADRKVEWDTLERVICLLMTLTVDQDGAAASEETQSAIQACQTDDVDVTHLDIVYPLVPDMGDLPDVPHNPCDEEFADDAYTGIEFCAGNIEYKNEIDIFVRAHEVHEVGHGLLTECFCVAEEPIEAEVGFPHELGPYLLFNTGFELNSASGFQVEAAGEWMAFTEGTQYAGSLSPWVSVTLPDLDAAFGLSGNQIVAQVAWAYGDPVGTQDIEMRGEEFPETMQHRFVRTGGYVYRNAQGFIVALKEISPSASSLGQDAQMTLYFGDPAEITHALAAEACPQMYPISLGRLEDGGAEEYCWEFSNTITMCQHGCFLFKTVTHGYLAFPVVEAPDGVGDMPDHYAATDQQGAEEHSMTTGLLADAR